MRLNYINGIGTAKLTATLGSRVTELNFNICNIKGQPEESTKEQTKHITLNRRIRTDVHGYRIKWTLHYDNLQNDMSVLYEYQRIANLEAVGYVLNLTPRVDEFQRSYEVITGDSPIVMKADNTDRFKVSGMEGIVFEFITVEPHQLNWIVATPAQYYADTQSVLITV